MSEKPKFEDRAGEVSEKVDDRELNDASLEDVAGGASSNYMRINNDGKFYARADPDRV